MTIRISVIFACRVEGNENSRLTNMMRTFTEKLSDKRLVEVLIKFDTDDKGAPAAIASLEPFKRKVDIRTFTGARGEGYSDLHKMYYDTFLQCSPTSEVVWIITDDIEIFYTGTDGWDEYIAQKLDEQHNPVFMFHTFDQIRPYEKRTAMETVDSPDGFPMWSKQWIIAQGGLGPIYSVDGWAALVERYVKLHYKIDPRVHLEKLSLHRHIIASDGPGNPRYDILRKKTIDFLVSDFSTQMVAANARSVYYAHRAMMLPLYKRVVMMSTAGARRMMNKALCGSPNMAHFAKRVVRKLLRMTKAALSRA